MDAAWYFALQPGRDPRPKERTVSDEGTFDDSAVSPARRTSSESPAYAPIRDHAAIGDGRTIALITLEGTIDWLCLPDLDSPSLFGALLDTESGGSFTLAPDAPFDAYRRYLPSTNVLETTFITDTGSVRVVDAMTLPGDGLAPQRELSRQIEAVAGEVPMRWAVTPRFGYGQERTSVGQ